MKPYMSNDTQNRDRTYADRKAFVLAEGAEQMAKAIAERNGEVVAQQVPAPLTEGVLPASRTVNASKERARLREAVSTARRAAFLRALGEMTYVALPLDEHEKAPHHQTVIDQTIEFAENTENWQPTQACTDLMEMTAELVATLGAEPTVEDAVAAVAEACEGEGEMAELIRSVGQRVESRVVAGAAGARDRSQGLEKALGEATGDSELDALRARRMAKRSMPCLIEALFIANRKTLTEDTGNEVSPDVLMVEAVCQYALLETMNALGIVTLDSAEDLVKRLVGRSR